MFYQIKLSRVIKFMYSRCGMGFIALLIILSSCSTALKFSAVKYDAESINKLLDKSSSMKYLTIIYNTDDAKSYKNPFSLISYARDAKGGYLDVPPYSLTSVDGKNANTFKGKMILGNLTLERDSIISLLTNPKTGVIIKNFDYLLFTPVLNHKYNYMYYEIKVMGADSSFTGGRAAVKVPTRPCPPALDCRPTN